MKKNNLISEDNYIEFSISKDDLIFYEIFQGSKNEIGRVKIEWDYLAKRFIYNSIPSEAEIENSINYIEDELMKDLELVNNKNLNLYTQNSQLIEIFGVKNQKKEYTQIDIEEEFTKYALLSMGRSPAYDKTTPNNKKYIALLVIREILHHLKFERISIINNSK